MKRLELITDDFDTILCEESDGAGVGFMQGKDYVTLSWEQAHKVRDWLQLAIAERVEQLHREVGL